MSALHVGRTGRMGAIAREQRYTDGRTCPICGGRELAARGKGARCYGYVSQDGEYIHCTREEYAGALAINGNTSTYAHRRRGTCKCGVTHAPAPASYQARSATRQQTRQQTHTHTRAVSRSQARQGATAAGSSERTPATRRASGEPVGVSGGVSAMDPARVASSKGGAPRRVGRSPDAIYGYTLADGTPVYRVERWRTVDTDTGELGKTFLQRRADATAPDGWRYGLADTPRLPYRLRELAAAPADTWVYICEGEKCVDALAAVGVLATCNSGGALHWRECAAIAREHLAGRHIVILPDNDGERTGRPHESYMGQRHALDVAASLADIAASVRVLMLPGLALKGDVYDWLEVGHTRGELEALAHAAPCYDSAAPAIWRLSDTGATGAWWYVPTPEDVPATGEPFERIRGRGTSDTTGGEGGTPDAIGAYIAIPGTRWYLTPDGARIVERKGRGEGEDYTPVYEWNAPIVHALVRFSAGETYRGQAILYDIEIEGRRERIAYHELMSGECWERWATLGIAGRTAFASMAATVQYIARRTQAPEYRGMRASGWIEHAGRHVLVLPSGELLGREGVVSGTLAYLDIAAHHAAPYQTPDGEPITARMDPLASSSSKPAQASALHFLADTAARSLATLTLCAHVRSLMYGIWRSDCTLILRGGSGRGKTTIGKYGRNLTGNFTPDTSASAAFTGPTAASIEKHLSQLKSLPMVLDDLVLREDMTPSERADVGKKVDMVVRSVANNEALRQRQTRNMEDAPAYKIDALPILTAEELPPEVKASALNRAVLLDIGETDVQVRRFYEDEAHTHRAALLAFGRGFMAWLAGEWDTRGAALAAQWIDTHREYMRQVERDILAARGGRPLPAYADRLPSNAAHLLLAAHVLATYASAAGVACPITAASVYSDLLAHLSAQVETIDALAAGGNDGEGVGERIGAAIREALARVDAFVTNADGTDATQHATLKPEQLGYRAAFAGGYQRGTRWLGEVTPDGEYMTLDRLALHGLLKHMARVEHWRGWHVSARELAAMLEKAGLLEKPRAGRHLEHRARRGDKLVRRLLIPCAAIWPDYGEGEDGEPPDGEPDTDNAGNTGADSSPDPLEDATPDSNTGATGEPDGAPFEPFEPFEPYMPDTLTYDGDTYDTGAGWSAGETGADPLADVADVADGIGWIAPEDKAGMLEDENGRPISRYENGEVWEV